MLLEVVLEVLLAEAHHLDQDHHGQDHRGQDQLHGRVQGLLTIPELAVDRQIEAKIADMPSQANKVQVEVAEEATIPSIMEAQTAHITEPDRAEA
mgnify:CR=1 FL=1